MKFTDTENKIVNWIGEDGRGHSSLITETLFDVSQVLPYSPSYEEVNAEVINDLLKLDMKSIRALREGDQQRLVAIENSAVDLRKKLKNAP